MSLISDWVSSQRFRENVSDERTDIDRERTNRLCILNSVLGKQCNAMEAAQLIGVSERHLWRLLAAYRKEGAAALAHGNRDRSPCNATSSTLKAQVITLGSGRYQGVNHSHFTELLAEREGIVLSRSTVRRLLTSAGISSSRHRQSPCHRCRRERMPQEGMLIQIDGSHHGWLEKRGPLGAVCRRLLNRVYSILKEHRPYQPKSVSL